MLVGRAIGTEEVGTSIWIALMHQLGLNFLGLGFGLGSSAELGLGVLAGTTTLELNLDLVHFWGMEVVQKGNEDGNLWD